MPKKEGAALKGLGIGGCCPEEGGAGVPCPQGPAPDGAQEPSTVETHPEETHSDSGHDAQSCSGQPAAGLGCTVRGATTQRMDSLEETLRELEATLSQMGTAPATGPPGSPLPLPPGPQVAASSPVLPSCLHAPVSWSSELEGGEGSAGPLCQPPPPTGLLSAPATLLGAWRQGGVCRQILREAGKLAYSGISPASPGRDQGLSPLLCICKPTNKVLSPFSIPALPSPSPV